MAKRTKTSAQRRKTIREQSLKIAALSRDIADLKEKNHELQKPAI